MKIFLIVTMGLIAGASARNSEYGVPAPIPRPAPPPQPTESYPNQQRVHRHVYVHVAPEEEPDNVDNKVIRVPGRKEKHVNIIFVKTPSSSSDQKTELVLPGQEQHRNLVYVLLKNGGVDSNIKIRQPSTKPQSKPKVYFIRYQPKEEVSESNSGPSELPRPIPTPTTLYGAPTPVSSQGYAQPRN